MTNTDKLIKISGPTPERLWILNANKIEKSYAVYLFDFFDLLV